MLPTPSTQPALTSHAISSLLDNLERLSQRLDAITLQLKHEHAERCSKHRASTAQALLGTI
jgi:hypothetical protein